MFLVSNLSLDGSDLNAKINEVVTSRLRNTGQGEFILPASAVKENRSYLCLWKVMLFVCFTEEQARLFIALFVKVALFLSGVI